MDYLLESVFVEDTIKKNKKTHKNLVIFAL